MLAVPPLVRAQEPIESPESAGALSAPRTASNPEAAAAVSKAVRRAAVLRERVVAGAGENGGDLVIRRIAEPVLTPEELAATLPAPARELTPAEKAARVENLRAARLAGPLETRLFSPEVLVFPGGVALFRWWAVDAARQFEPHAVWVAGLDCSLLPAVNELNAGRRRWLLTACSVRPAAGKTSFSLIAPPTPAEWAAAPGVAAGETAVLVEEGGDSPADLEPLTALIRELTVNAPRLAGVLAARKTAAEQATAEAAARAGLPQGPSVIRFWTSENDEVRTLSKSLPARDGRK